MGLSPVDDYEVFRNLCYEDDERVCYIDLGKPEPKKPNDMDMAIGIKFGRKPERLWAKHLRPEQRVFFEKHWPDVLKRFKED